MFDFFSGHDEDVHELTVFSHYSSSNKKGQVNVRWPNYAIDFSVDKSNFNRPGPVCILLLKD